MKQCFFVLIQIFLLYTKTICAQAATIKGIILDKESSMTIENVVVSIDKGKNHAHSDEKGNFCLVNLPFGKHELQFEHKNFETQILRINVATEDTLSVNISLFSNAINLTEIAVVVDKPVSSASSSYLNQISLMRRPRNSAQDLLKMIPGLFIAQHAGGGKAEQIFIRGFDCDHGTDIASFVDGIPVNMPSHGHGQGYADLHFLIPEVVDAISVFKGTSSPLYGDFATGAAVNFNTLDSLPNNLLQIESGIVPHFKRPTSNRALAMLKIPFTGTNVSSYFAADFVNNRGFFDRSQDFKRTNLFSKTTVSLNENSRIHFSASSFASSWNSSGQLPERAIESGLTSRFGSLDSNEGGTTQRNNFNLTYNTKLGSGEFEAHAYVFTYRFKLFSDFTFFLKDSVNGDMIEQDDNRTTRGLNTKYTVRHKLFNMYNTFTAGVSSRSDEIENQLWKAPKRTRTEANSRAFVHQRSNSVFISEVFRFNPHFKAEAGLRYDYFIFDVEDLLSVSSHTNYSGFNYQSALNPKLNLIYTANDKLQCFLNAGRGYHSNDARATVLQKNQHELPKAVSAELGSILHLKHTMLSASIWVMELSNELVYLGDDGTTENRGASRRYGFDISGRSQLFSWLYADVDINFSRGRFIDTLFGIEKKEGYYIPLAPTLTSTGGLFTNYKNLEIGLRYRYMRDRPANEFNTITAHGYTVMDFNANYKTKRYKVGLVIENLLNVKWNDAQFAIESKLKDEANPIDQLHATPGTPFYAKLVLSYLF